MVIGCKEGKIGHRRLKVPVVLRIRKLPLSRSVEINPSCIYKHVTKALELYD